MDLTVTPDLVQIAHVLTQLRLLVKDVLIPRITNLECDLRELRKVTWPICQALKETSQLSDIDNKKQFLECLENIEIQELLKIKAQFSQSGEITNTTSHLLNEEYNKLVKVINSL